MSGRILYFGNPALLLSKNKQLIIKSETTIEEVSIPIEDINVVIFDNQQLTFTQNLIADLLEYNSAIITCNHYHHPTGLMLNLACNSLQSEKFITQINVSQPLMKQLWKQTIKSKISNQSILLQKQNIEIQNMKFWSNNVKSGDPNNLEGQAAAYYWRNIFSQIKDFNRRRDGVPPNNLLNYGYAILRAIVARSLVGSGLLPTLGIHHHNRYNHYCLADDIMEPYRPYCDAVVIEIMNNGEDYTELNDSIKKQLIGIGTTIVNIDDENTQLFNAVQKTTASLVKCFEGSTKKITYPKLR